MKTSRLLFNACAALLSICSVANVYADGANEPIPSFYQEAGLSRNSGYLNQHPNEHIDTFTGKLQWHYTDLFIPGNGGLDLNVQRSYTSLGEEFPADSTNGIGWTMHFGRVLRKATTDICDFANNGPLLNPVLELPDGSRHIMYIGLDSTSFITSDFWKGSCSSGHLVVSSPDGTRYDMDTPGLPEGDAVHPVNTYYVSKITDRNSNTMSFTYAFTSGTRFGVQTVNTSDGRAVTFNYDGSGNVHTVTNTNGGATYMTYLYTSSATMANQYFLTEVQRPDGVSWKYDYNLFGIGTPGSSSIKTVTYPTGGKIDYNYDYVNFNLNLPRSTVVTRKMVDKVDETSANGGIWTYSYKPATETIPWVSGANGSYLVADPNLPNQLDQTTVVGPDGTRVYSHLGYTSLPSGAIFNMGLLAFLQTGGVQFEANSWGGTLISNQTNMRPGDTLNFDSETYAPFFAGKDTNRSGQWYSVAYGNLDNFGNPGTITETGTDTKVTAVTYALDTNKWILHLKKDESISVNGGAVGNITRGFDPNGNLLSENRFGVATTFAYTAEGDLATRTDARTNPTTYTSYMRGIAQQEVHPEGVTIARQVSSAGNVTSQTDGELATTTYGYDVLNRLTSIVHPLGNPVTVVWNPNTRTVLRGNYQEITTFDQFGRDVTVQHNDLGTGESISQSTTYDKVGRRIFQSHPNSTTVGTHYQYDIVGQLVQMGLASNPDGTLAYGWRTYYPAYDTVQLTNERDKVFTYRYRAFGDPEHRELTDTASGMAVTAPEASASLSVTRNGLGQLTNVVQDGKTRLYGYDDHHFMTTKTEPETGVTIYGRDSVGNMSSRQVGTSPVTNFAYDNLNRLGTVTYPDGITVTHQYYKDDKLKTLDNGVASQAYLYDANKNLKTETLVAAGQTFTTTYDYSANDALDLLTYGSGKTVKYNPDAFGRPTTAVPYLTSVAHHPTGEVSSLTYANGVKTDVTLDVRNWPRHFVTNSVNLNQSMFDTIYTYDRGGNVTNIDEWWDASYNRNMVYDDIDRLTQVSGPWGAGTFMYDGRGNLKSQVLGNFNLAYVFDPVTERLTGTTGSKTMAFNYDAYGNVIGNGAKTFAYSDASTMRCAQCGLSDESLYDYDGGGMRVRTQKSGASTYFVYGLGGKLLWEQSPAGLKEYIYLSGKQVATRQQVAVAP